MAENAAHITSSLHSRPSIFEVLAQESLSELLYPSFKILVQFLGTKNPDRYGWINKWNEEVFLGINSLLQLHFLSYKGASFSESFYGLRRAIADEKLQPLTSGALCWSMFCLVGLPYMARKTGQLISELNNPKVELCHRAVQACWQFVSLVQYLLYLTGRATAHSPLLTVANLSLQYCPEEVEQPFQWRQIFSNPREGCRIVGHSATQALQLAAFFLQCLQWWHSDSVGGNISTLPVPDPPQSQNVNLEKSTPSVCPVCQEPWKIETALLTSGYVFCYRCIKEFVTKHKKCPVTGLPTSLDELIRLYPTK